MKKQTVTRLTSLSILFGVCLASGVVAFFGAKQSLKPAHAYTAKSVTSIKNINLNDASDETIRNYYSALDALPESERKGMNLLKNLKPILKNGQQYFKYDGGNLWAMYEITDRDWAKSPASAIPGYDATTNTITNYSYGSSASNPGMNPYIHALYVRRTDTNLMHAWARESDSTVSHGNNKEWGIDQEHIWAKSQGFNASGAGGARGDPMHLWPGDSDVNSSLHNDQMYGFVNITSTTKHGKWSYATDNYVGTSLTLGTTMSSEDVFEPQDSDKGDIARAIFYLVARYNYLSGEDSDGISADNPNLELVQDNTVRTGYTSDTTNTGKQGILTDLLEWHHLDPVDEFEIHRNNILFNSYTFNRNPFIDFPEWVDYIWGTVDYEGRVFQDYDNTPTGYADRNLDVINGYSVEEGLESIELEGTYPTEFEVGDEFSHEGMSVTAHYYGDQVDADVTSEAVFSGYDMNAAGTQTVTVSYTEDEVTVTAEYQITVNPPEGTFVLDSITLSGNYPTEFEVGDEFSSEGLVVTANYLGKDSQEVTNYIIGGYDMSIVGEQTVTVSYTEDDITKTATYQITINQKQQPIDPENPDKGVPWYKMKIAGPIEVWHLFIGVPVILIVIILIAVGVLKVNKKGKLKVNKSGVKKIVKGSSSKKKTKK